MTVQKDEALDRPLDENEKPRLYTDILKPSLSQAALNLIIDYKRTLQGDLNKKMFWSFKTWSVLMLCISGYLYSKLSEQLQYHTWTVILKSRDFRVQLFYVLVAVLMIISMAFALLGETTKFLKIEADSIADDTTKVFGFDLKEFAQLPDDEEEFNKTNTGSKQEQNALLKEYQSQLQKGNNTQLIIYRNKPIAVVTIVQDKELTRDDQYVVKIKGLSVRKVYADTDLQKDLMQWVYLRSRDLYLQDGNLNEDKPLRIFIELYNFESKMLKVLKELPGWQLVSSEKLTDMVCGGVFGVERQTWGIGMLVTPKK